MTTNISDLGRKALSAKANAQKQADGKFGHLQKDAPATELPSAPIHDYDAIATQASTDVSNLWESRSAFHNLESAAAARCIAAVVRKEYPDAEKVALALSRDSHTWEAVAVYGPTMGRVDVDDTENLAGDDDILDSLNSLNIDPYDSGTSPYMDIHADRSGGHTATLRIEDALMPPEPEADEAVNRGATILSQYSVQNGLSGQGIQGSAVNLLEDLDDWARDNGQDLAELLARAQQNTTR